MDIEQATEEYEQDPEAFEIKYGPKAVQDVVRSAVHFVPFPSDDKEPYVPSFKEDKWGDTAIWAAKGPFEEAKERFLKAGQGATIEIPKTDNKLMRAYMQSLDYAASMGLSGLNASDAAFRFAVGSISELLPANSNEQEKRFTRDVASMGEAFAGILSPSRLTRTIDKASDGIGFQAKKTYSEQDPSKIGMLGGNNANLPPRNDKWGRDPLTGDLMFEFSDHELAVFKNMLPELKYTGPKVTNAEIEAQGEKLSEVIHHPELFAQYPDLEDAKVVSFTEKQFPGSRGFAIPSRKVIAVNNDLMDRDPDSAKSTVVHEIQHLIQEIEGWDSGTNKQSSEVHDIIQLLGLNQGNPAEEMLELRKYYLEKEKWEAEVNKEVFDTFRNKPLDYIASFLEKNHGLSYADAIEGKLSTRELDKVPISADLMYKRALALSNREKWSYSHDGGTTEYQHPFLKKSDEKLGETIDYFIKEVSGLDSLRDEDILKEVFGADPKAPDGWNVGPFTREVLKDKLPPAPVKPETNSLVDWYEKMYRAKRGEVQASISQKRMDMTDEEREANSWILENDIPLETQWSSKILEELLKEGNP